MLNSMTKMGLEPHDWLKVDSLRKSLAVLEQCFMLRCFRLSRLSAAIFSLNDRYHIRGKILPAMFRRKFDEAKLICV